jgi:hypothetical protein
MIGRKATVGLSLLCALMFCALAAQSASAQVGTKAEKTTAFTCVAKAKGDFSDAHCDKKVTPGTGSFGHVEIKPGETTEIEVTNEGTANETKEAEVATLKGTLGGVTVHITCAVATTNGASKPSWIENVDTSGKHTVKGRVVIRFSSCTLHKPLKCVVKEPIETIALFEGVEELGAGKKEMGLEFKPENAAEPFAALTLENKGAESCALNGKKLEVFGSAIATGMPAPTEAHSGATSMYETEKEMQTLEVGKGTGQKAEFLGTFTTRMKEKTVGKENPISLTTVT